jgi:hypothetical protein
MIVSPRRRPIEFHGHGEDRVARIGDRFHAFGEIGWIKAVNQAPLGDIAERIHRETGFRSPEEFIDFWNDIHPIKGFVPEQPAWLYWFELTDLTLAKTVTATNWCPFCPINYQPNPADPSPCEHFIGYAGQVESHPDNIGVPTPVSIRIYRENAGVLV